MDLSAAEARRIAIAAQGFSPTRTRGGADGPSSAAILRLIERLGALQLDSVNVFSRTHYLPVFSRLGPYDRTKLDRLAGHTEGRINRRLVEYWAHEASLIPLRLHPLFRWRMADLSGAWGSMQRIIEQRPELVAEVLELVSEQGPIRARDTGTQAGRGHVSTMWNWHEGKVALEHLFYTGRIGAARRINFERRYDLIERILPAEIHAAPAPSPQDAQRELTRIAAAALGVATEPDLGDYFRLPRADSKLRVAELVDSGELSPVTVKGWDAPAYLWNQARRPRALKARALLSPFDSLIWFRPRAHRLFDFHYRIEIYTPAPKRLYGYYVLPFLLGDRLVARVDLKSDRQASTLRVQGAYAEATADPVKVAPELAAELRLTAGWLGLDTVEVARKGDLADQLRSALKAS